MGLNVVSFITRSRFWIFLIRLCVFVFQLRQNPDSVCGRGPPTTFCISVSFSPFAFRPSLILTNNAKRRWLGFCSKNKNCHNNFLFTKFGRKHWLLWILKTSLLLLFWPCIICITCAKGKNNNNKWMINYIHLYSRGFQQHWVPLSGNGPRSYKRELQSKLYPTSKKILIFICIINWKKEKGPFADVEIAPQTLNFLAFSYVDDELATNENDPSRARWDLCDCEFILFLYFILKK